MKYGDEGFVRLADGSTSAASVIECKGGVLSTCFGTFLLTGGKWLFVVDGQSEFIIKT